MDQEFVHYYITNEHNNGLDSTVPQKGINHFEFSFLLKMQYRSIAIVIKLWAGHLNYTGLASATELSLLQTHSARFWGAQCFRFNVCKGYLPQG